MLSLLLVACGGEEPRGSAAVAPHAVQAAVPAAAPIEAAPVAAGPRVTFDTRKGPVVVTVEVARTPEQQRRGLMYRRHLAPGTGMLFLMPDQRQQSFWMKNTLIPLDMIFVNNALEVVGIVHEAEPQTLTPRKVDAHSRYVVEVPGGYARVHGIARGDRMAIDDVPGAPL